MSSPLRTRASNEIDPYAASHIYYGPNSHHHDKKHLRARTFSTNNTADTSGVLNRAGIKVPTRRGSHDERSLGLEVVFKLPVEQTIQGLIASKDANENYQITKDGGGPKTIRLGTVGSNGHKLYDLRGTYVLGNLMQEMHLAKQHGLSVVEINEKRLTEAPDKRLVRLITHEFWPSLTRWCDASNIAVAGKDPKDWTSDPRPRIYIPRGAPEQHAYYTQVAREQPEMRLDVCWLPEKITPDDVRDMNAKPGLLAIEMEEYTNPKSGLKELRGLPFVVPGGRFNELYGWDSYMESLGLIACHRVDLAKSMVQHFIFCIKHYGKILNANRSYYLSRSQPPFLTDMALRVYDQIKFEPGALEFLRKAILAAIKEYHTVWMAKPRLDPVTGLSRYRPEGRGVPPETEATHFIHLLDPFAKKHNMAFQDFVEAYNQGTIVEPDLDEYFLHDRAVRESGHDTSYRLERVCANLATIDLNSLLYKYETDIALCIRKFFKDSLPVPDEFLVNDMKSGHRESSSIWDRRAKLRKTKIDKYLWNSERGMYFDYDTITKQQCTYESATTFWALWAGVASPAQAAKLVENSLPLFEKEGGLVSGTEESRGAIGLERPNRQWDYPYGWAPQQILAWSGLERYGYTEEAVRLAYRWTLMMTKAFMEYHGVVVEKYDVTKKSAPHKVEAEYGNQGADFKGVAREGFGWVNASYIIGIDMLSERLRKVLRTLASWDEFEAADRANTIKEDILAESMFEDAQE